MRRLSEAEAEKVFGGSANIFNSGAPFPPVLLEPDEPGEGGGVTLSW